MNHPTPQQRKLAAQIFGHMGGKIGGKSKSKAKVAASRRNAVLATEARKNKKVK